MNPSRPDYYTLKNQIGKNVFVRQPSTKYFNYGNYLNNYNNYQSQYYYENPNSPYLSGGGTKHYGGGASGSGGSEDVSAKGIPPWITNPNKSETEQAWNIIRQAEAEARLNILENIQNLKANNISQEAVDKLIPKDEQQAFNQAITVLRDPYSTYAEKEVAKATASNIVERSAEYGNRVAGYTTDKETGKQIPVSWEQYLGNPSDQASWVNAGGDQLWTLYYMVNIPYMISNDYDLDIARAGLNKIQHGQSLSLYEGEQIARVIREYGTADNLIKVEEQKYYAGSLEELKKLEGQLDPYNENLRQEAIKKIENHEPLDTKYIKFVQENTGLDYGSTIQKIEDDINTSARETSDRIASDLSSPQGNPNTTGGEQPKVDYEAVDPYTAKSIADNMVGRIANSLGFISAVGEITGLSPELINPEAVLQMESGKFLENMGKLTPEERGAIIKEVENIQKSQDIAGAEDKTAGVLDRVIDRVQAWGKNELPSLFQLDPVSDKERVDYVPVGTYLGGYEGYYNQVPGSTREEKANALTYEGISDYYKMRNEEGSIGSQVINISDPFSKVLYGRNLAGDVEKPDVEDIVQIGLTIGDIITMGGASSGLDIGKYGLKYVDNITGALSKLDNIPHPNLSNIHLPNIPFLKGKENDVVYLVDNGKNGVRVYMEGVNGMIKGVPFSWKNQDEIWEFITKNAKNPNTTMENFVHLRGKEALTWVKNEAKMIASLWPDQATIPTAKGGSQAVNFLNRGGASGTLHTVGQIFHYGWAGTKLSLEGVALSYGLSFLAWAVGDTIMQPMNYTITTALKEGTSPASSVVRLMNLRDTYNEKLTWAKGIAGIGDTINLLNPLAWYLTSEGYKPSSMAELFMDGYKDLGNSSAKLLSDYHYWTGDFLTGRPTTYQEFQTFWGSKSTQELNAMFSNYGSGKSYKDDWEYRQFVGYYMESRDLDKDGKPDGASRWETDIKYEYSAEQQAQDGKNQMKKDGVSFPKNLLSAFVGGVVGADTGLGVVDRGTLFTQDEMRGISDVVNKVTDVNQLKDVATQIGMDWAKITKIEETKEYKGATKDEQLNMLKNELRGEIWESNTPSTREERLERWNINKEDKGDKDNKGNAYGKDKDNKGNAYGRNNTQPSVYRPQTPSARILVPETSFNYSPLGNYDFTGFGNEIYAPESSRQTVTDYQRYVDSGGTPAPFTWTPPDIQDIRDNWGWNPEPFSPIGTDFGFAPGSVSNVTNDIPVDPFAPSNAPVEPPVDKQDMWNEDYEDFIGMAEYYPLPKHKSLKDELSE